MTEAKLCLSEEGNKSRCGEWKEVKEVGNVFFFLMVSLLSEPHR